VSRSKPPAPRKSLGQHFLTDPRVSAKIVAALKLDDTNRIVEIGPGRGALTGSLISTGKPVTAVETDARLAAHLSERFGQQLDIIESDILEVDAQSLVHKGVRTILVGNLPYNLGGPILEWIFQSAKLWTQVVVMLQLEVAQRLVAEPQTRDFGPLAIARALRFDARKLFLVRPGAFFPPPRVQSAVVELTPTDDPPIRPEDPAHFMHFAHALFEHRRKNIRNNLKLAFDLDDAALDRLFADSGVDGRRRAEELAWPDINQLYHSNPKV
jgi:16S rRNA (adenine1518-N6/adenine1519-N6)-dimethyltransferase